MSIESFTDLLSQSGLTSADNARVLLDRFRQMHPSATNNEEVALFCEFLIIRAGVLTRFQSRMLREGKYKGFFLGEYVILDRTAKEGHSFRCLARHMRSRQLVTLVVRTPEMSFDVIPVP